MLAAINFDYNARTVTNKIRNEWPNRYLPTELEFRKASITQGKPKFPFGVSHPRA